MTWLGWLPWKHKLDGLPPHVVWFSLWSIWLCLPARCSLPPSGCRPGGPLLQEPLSSCLQSLLSLLQLSWTQIPWCLHSLCPPEQIVTGFPFLNSWDVWGVHPCGPSKVNVSVPVHYQPRMFVSIGIAAHSRCSCKHH